MWRAGRCDLSTTVQLLPLLARLKEDVFTQERRNRIFPVEVRRVPVRTDSARFVSGHTLTLGRKRFTGRCDGAPVGAGDQQTERGNVLGTSQTYGVNP